MLKNFDKDDFRVVFRASYTLLVSIWVGIYLWNVTFAEEGAVSEFAEFIVGFVLGTLIATLINFYFGGNEDEESPKRSNSRSTDPDTSDADGLPTPGEDVPGDVT